MSGNDESGIAPDLEIAEEALDDEGVVGDIVLGVLDGTTDPDDWIRNVEYGNVLILDIDGDLNQLAQELAAAVSEMGGNLTRFRGFLVVSPPDVEIDTSRLN